MSTLIDKSGVGYNRTGFSKIYMER